MPENVISLLGMLTLVVLILIAAYWVTRAIGSYGGASGRLPHFPGSGPAQTGAGGSRRFTVLAQLSVGRNERIVLVRLQNSCFLLGVTTEGISLLKELEPAEAEAWTAEEKDSVSAPVRFMDVLKENMRKRK